MATHSIILAWKTPRIEEPGGLQSMGSQGVRHDLVTKHTYTPIHTHSGRVTSCLGFLETVLVLKLKSHILGEPLSPR